MLLLVLGVSALETPSVSLREIRLYRYEVEGCVEASYVGRLERYAPDECGRFAVRAYA